MKALFFNHQTSRALLVSGLLLATNVGCHASDHDFNGVVDSLEQHYGIHGHRLPMMGFAGFCASLATHGGVKGLRVAEFDRSVKGPLEADDISRVIGDKLGPEWSPVVKEHERHGEDQTVIFVQPAGHAMRMLIAEYEHGELNVVRVELDGEKLAKWMKDPKDPSHPSAKTQNEGDVSASRAQ